MYQINKSKNQCEQIQKMTFSELGFREREHLQEWFAKNPQMFGEELLIIQKEFDGFSETNERLDLLALDKDGNLVIIENKLDDSGKDVTWQALKYASYCSSLNKENIRSIYQEYLDKENENQSAENNISEFLDIDYDEVILNQGSSQRLILVAAKFRKEVTSTVVWLTNFNLHIKCIKVTPYKLNDTLLLDVNQIIPVKDVEDYTISMIDKQSDEKAIQMKNQAIHSLRFNYWKMLLSELEKETDLFSKISPKKENWIGVGAGISGISFIFVLAKKRSRVEFYIDTGSKNKNEGIFDYFYEKAEIINAELNNYNVEWEKLEDKNACRICIPIAGNYYQEENWENMIGNMVSAMVEFNNVLSPYVVQYKNKGK